MEEFSLVPADRLFARIEEELSSFSANGLLDVGRLYQQLKYFSTQMGLAVYKTEELVINLNNHRTELPCDFYLLDSAWLCEGEGEQINQAEGGGLAFQAKSVVYTERACDTIINHANPGNPDPDQLYPIAINACVQDTVLARTTTREYVKTASSDSIGNWRRWRHLILLKLNNKKSVRQICSKNCPNMFSHSPHEISINRQGDNYYLYSTLKHPTIYIRYYAYPIDSDTGLPLIPEDAILQEALYWYLVHYFIQGIFINGDDNNMADKLKYLTEKADFHMSKAMTYVKLPTFNRMKLVGDRVRNKWASYEILGNSRHW